MKRWDLLIRLFILSILFENLRIVSVAGAAFKMYHIVALLGIAIALTDRTVKLPKKPLSLAFLFLFPPLFSLYRIHDLKEYLKTYVIYLLASVFLVLCFPKMKRRFEAHSESYIRMTVIVLDFAACFGILQFVLDNYFGISALNEIFGSFTFHNVAPGRMLGLRRATSVFHEPSYFGWIGCFGLALLLFTRKKHKTDWLSFAVIAAGIVVSLSTSAYVIALVLVFLDLVFFMKSRVGQFIGILAFAILILVCFSGGLSIVFDKMKDFHTERTSAYERLTTPWLYMKKTLGLYPLFGRGMGQSGTIDKVGVIGMYNEANNSVFGVFITFGLTALFYIGLFLYAFFKPFKRDKSVLLLVVFCFFMYFSTGAFLAFDTLVVFLLCVLIANRKKLRPRRKNESQYLDVRS